MGNKLSPPILFLTLMCLLLTCSGCWDLEEIDRRIFVTALGIDLAPKGDLLITVQVPLPEEIHTGGTSQAHSQGQKVFNTLSVTAASVFEGFRLLQAKTNRRLVIQENKIILIGEAVARLGVSPVLAWFARSPKATPQALIYIVRRYTAKELLSFDPVVKRLPGQELAISSESALKYDLTYYLSFWQFRQKMLDTGKDPYAPLIDYERAENQYLREGLAVFDEDRLAGELDPKEAQIFGLMTDQMRSGGMTFELPPEKYGPGRRASFRNVNGTTRIAARLTKGKPFFGITTEVKATLSELVGEAAPGDGTQISLSDYQQLQAAAARIIKRRETSLIQKLQSLHSDIINFGEQMRFQHYSWWKRHDWKRSFPAASFRVNVKVHIVRDGVLR